MSKDISLGVLSKALNLFKDKGGNYKKSMNKRYIYVARDTFGDYYISHSQPFKDFKPHYDKYYNWVTDTENSGITRIYEEDFKEIFDLELEIGECKKIEIRLKFVKD
ncbi:MAG: hypothetical protein ACE5HR_00285 [bacterium]